MCIMPLKINKIKVYKNNYCIYEKAVVECYCCLKSWCKGGTVIMAKCEICGKGVTFGIKVSHSHRRSNRTWKPNVRRVKAIVNGTPTRVYACTRCLRSGKVNRAV